MLQVRKDLVKVEGKQIIDEKDIDQDIKGVHIDDTDKAVYDKNNLCVVDQAISTLQEDDYDNEKQNMNLMRKRTMEECDFIKEIETKNISNTNKIDDKEHVFKNNSREINEMKDTNIKQDLVELKQAKLIKTEYFEEDESDNTIKEEKFDIDVLKREVDQAGYMKDTKTPKILKQNGGDIIDKRPKDQNLLLKDMNSATKVQGKSDAVKRKYKMSESSGVPTLTGPPPVKMLYKFDGHPERGLGLISCWSS